MRRITRMKKSFSGLQHERLGILAKKFGWIHGLQISIPKLDLEGPIVASKLRIGYKKIYQKQARHGHLTSDCHVNARSLKSAQ